MYYQKWFSLTAIQVGVYICTPALMLGAFLFQHYGLYAGLAGMAAGVVIIWLLSLPFVSFGVRTRMICVQAVEHYFGRRGAQVIGTVYGIGLIGWFALQLSLMTQSLKCIFGGGSMIFLRVATGMALTLSLMRGLKSLEKMADYTFPVLIMILIACIKMTFDSLDTDAAAVPLCENKISFGGASIVIVGVLGAIFDLPTYYAVAVDRKQAHISLALLCFAVYPLGMATGFFLAWRMPDKTLTDAMLGLGGHAWQLTVYLYFMLAHWLANCGNLYAAAMALSRLPGKNPFSLRILLCGSLGTLLALVPPLSFFEDMLNLVSITVSAAGGVVMACYLYSRMKVKHHDPIIQKLNYYSALGAGITGLLAYGDVLDLTGSPYADAFLVAAASVPVLRVMRVAFKGEL